MSFNELPDFDYSLSGWYTTGMAAVVDPSTWEREFSVPDIYTTRISNDRLLYGKLHTISVNPGGHKDGYASLRIRGSEILLMRFAMCGPDDIPLYAAHYLEPGDKWEWEVKAMNLKPGHECGVSVCVGITSFWKSSEKETE